MRSGLSVEARITLGEIANSVCVFHVKLVLAGVRMAPNF